MEIKSVMAIAQEHAAAFQKLAQSTISAPGLDDQTTVAGNAKVHEAADKVLHVITDMTEAVSEMGDGIQSIAKDFRSVDQTASNAVKALSEKV